MFVLTLFQIGAAQAAEPRLALIIDDICGGTWRQSRDAVELSQRIPLAISVLPNGEASCRTKLYRSKHNANLHWMLHMPMQPIGKEDPGEGAIRLGDTHEDMLDKLDTAYARVPMAAGFNNHMGSAVTRDPALMEIILQWAAARKLFFVDSATSTFHSCDIATRKNVPCLRNRVFLDDNQSYQSIADSLEKARRISLKNNGAPTVIIGHPHPHTIEVLNSFIRKKRVKFVPVTALVDRLQPEARSTAQPPSD